MTPEKGPVDSEATQPAEQPLLAVVKGKPTAEELAALTAVVLSLGSSEPAAPEKPGARHWIRRQQLQLAPKPGPGSWKRSRG
ncbi:acyl-CoA carboxylase subunit epsilon [Arthrobacter sp. UKPF54-2]|uniref:acyl-CoA carboxylase subunit epsilon n=1 Tax=Arthrobacter sp. UKPF54-2 TaxID=2600159 RepID=UPI0011B1932D|nr:acyl-CoA carboxylase subunit epsilon [Arthrobacter sp. UKPF54-2]QDY88860.1 acyl-CoA carboxylase subunit epsilon [Arthrobacter sp. UKPF54-2]